MWPHRERGQRSPVANPSPFLASDKRFMCKWTPEVWVDEQVFLVEVLSHPLLAILVSAPVSPARPSEQDVRAV